MPLIHSLRLESVVIAGAGGFGLELYDYLYEESLMGGPEVAGFLDDVPASVDRLGIDVPYLGGISGYRAKPGEGVVVSIGDVRARERVLATLTGNGVPTPAYVHLTAHISPNAHIGAAVLICPMSIVNSKASMGFGAVANVHCSVAHGASVGEYSVLSPYAALNGDAVLGARCFLGTRATVFPRVNVDDGCVIDSHTAVHTNVQSDCFISARRPSEINARGQVQRP